MKANIRITGAKIQILMGLKFIGNVKVIQALSMIGFLLKNEYKKSL